MLSSLPVIDKELKVSTPNGPFWRRYSFDGYGETRTGGEWRITDPGTGTTLGRAWPLLAGERGEYTVTAGGSGAPYLRRWRARPGRPTCSRSRSGTTDRRRARPAARAGEGTRSATPLTWSHAGLVRLAWTIQRGAPVDQQAVVADRYCGGPGDAAPLSRGSGVVGSPGTARFRPQQRGIRVLPRSTTRSSAGGAGS